MNPATIAILVQWILAGQQAIQAGDAFWEELSALLTKHDIAHNKAQLLTWAAEARSYQAHEHQIAQGDIPVSPV